MTYARVEIIDFHSSVGGKKNPKLHRMNDNSNKVLDLSVVGS